MSAAWEPALVEAAARVLGVRLAVIPDRRRALLEMASDRARAAGFAGVEDWVAALSDPRVLKAEEQLFVQVATVGFTFFDRDRGQLDALAASLARRSGPVRVWSAGCSSGEEVWTLALALAQQGAEFSIVGSDVDGARLEVARRGRYVADRLERMSATERARYFVPDGAGMVRVVPELRQKVSFFLHNLADQQPLIGPFDAIVCRNVLMYFTPEAAGRVLEGFRTVLAADGRVLFAGHEAPTAARWTRRDDGDLLAWGPGVGGVSRARERSVRSAAPRAMRAPPQRRVPTPVSAPPAALPGPPAAPRLPSTSAAVRLGERACAALAAHRWAEALDDFTAALALQPDWAELHYLLGVVHRKTADLDSGRQAFRRALFLDDQFWPAAWMLSSMLDPEADRAQRRRLRDGALTDAQLRPVEELFHIPHGMLWSPTVDQLMAHPHARRWRL